MHSAHSANNFHQGKAHSYDCLLLSHHNFHLVTEEHTPKEEQKELVRCKICHSDCKCSFMFGDRTVVKTRCLLCRDVVLWTLDVWRLKFPSLGLNTWSPGVDLELLYLDYTEVNQSKK